MNALRALLAAAGVAAAAFGLAALSRLPWTAEPESDALVRFSWRAAGERVEECREPSAEELAALPRHMRMERICEGRVAPFRLRVELDGALAFDERIRAGGAREDRPASVFRELRVAPGAHRLAVRFEVERPDQAPRGERAPLVLDETLELAPRSVALVTLGENADRLVLVRSEPR